jgi:GNAT superfamily N-acetyltransferase
MRKKSEDIQRQVKIRKFVKKDAENASSLILRTFQRFLAADCTGKAQEEFTTHHLPSTLIKRSEKDSFFVAERNDDILGVAVLENDRLRALFVDEKVHKLGVASCLLAKTEQLARKKGYKKIKLRSSLYAVKFYQKKGYKKSTGVIKSHGITFQPMVKSFRKDKLLSLLEMRPFFQ